VLLVEVIANTTHGEETEGGNNPEEGSRGLFHAPILPAFNGISNLKTFLFE